MTPTDPGSGQVPVELRRARLDEAEAVADLYWQVRLDHVGAIPPSVHPQEDVRRWVRDLLIPSYDVWVADVSGTVVGFIALGEPDWVEHLYVASAWAGRGIGHRLLEVATRELTGPVQLWTFQSNVAAHRFYERHGFVAVEWTDGNNQEGEPDVRYVLPRP